MFLLEKALAATETRKPFDFGFINRGFDSLLGKSESASVEILVTNVVDILLFVAGAMAVIYLVYSGILYITAAGNPDAVKKGQQGIINAAIGIAVIVLAFFIARGVANYVQTSVGTGGSAPATTTTPTTPTTTTTPTTPSAPPVDPYGPGTGVPPE